MRYVHIINLWYCSVDEGKLVLYSCNDNSIVRSAFKILKLLRIIYDKMTFYDSLKIEYLSLNNKKNLTSTNSDDG